jgi:DNA-binding CsgD family transcriptional regulator
MSAARTGDARRAVSAAAEAVHAAMYARRPDLARAAAEVAVSAHDPHEPTERFLAHHAEGVAASLADEPRLAHDAMKAATDLLLRRRLLDTHPDLLLWAVNADLFLDAIPPPLHPSVLATLERVRESGELVWSPRVVRLVGVRDLARGAWGAGYAAAEDATELSRLAGQRTQVAEGLLLQAFVEAARGQEGPCLAHSREAGAIVADLEVRWLSDLVWGNQGLLHLTLGRPEEAAQCYARCPEGTEGVVRGLVESLVGAGRHTEASEVLTRAGDTVSSGSVAGCLLLGDEPAARRLAQHADAAESTFEAARLRLTAGSILRRCGARADARLLLRTAEATFTGLGAQPWAERARGELAASGATLRRGPEGQDLSAGELRVAGLVAEGRSNKEVAAALFLSPKTVEFHLGRAFRKLGVSNRTALAARLADLGLR